ncbi:MAG: hypothetical protein RSA99_02420 [Oscillospiraceae bacterium]
MKEKQELSPRIKREIVEKFVKGLSMIDIYSSTRRIYEYKKFTKTKIKNLVDEAIYEHLIKDKIIKKDENPLKFE